MTQNFHQSPLCELPSFKNGVLLLQYLTIGFSKSCLKFKGVGYNMKKLRDKYIVSKSAKNSDLCSQDFLISLCFLLDYKFLFEGKEFFALPEN